MGRSCRQPIFQVFFISHRNTLFKNILKVLTGSRWQIADPEEELFERKKNSSSGDEVAEEASNNRDEKKRRQRKSKGEIIKFNASEERLKRASEN